ncbi:MAG: hypothetical protein AB7E59_04435 [Pusillimonas sp.]
MVSTSRRAFFTGRRTAQTAWGQFSQSLQRVISGTFHDDGEYDGCGRGRLSAGGPADVRHALELCVLHGVVLQLDGLDYASFPVGQSVLRVDPRQGQAQCQALPDAPHLWFVQPGCLVGELQQAGVRQFDDFPGYLSVAACVADRTLMNWPTGQTWRSGLMLASVVLADGSTGVLGAFGPGNRKPLDSLTLQNLVPGLFRLAADVRARDCANAGYWPGRYRLDALMPATGRVINLSHLLLGHGGDLVWVDWMVFESVPEPVTPPVLQGWGQQAGQPDDLWYTAQGIDLQVKGLFDPGGVFPHPGQDL